MEAAERQRPMAPPNMRDEDDCLASVLSQKFSESAHGRLSCKMCPCHQRPSRIKDKEDRSTSLPLCQRQNNQKSSPFKRAIGANPVGETQESTLVAPLLHPAALESQGSLPILKRLQKLSSRPGKFNQYSPSSSPTHGPLSKPKGRGLAQPPESLAMDYRTGDEASTISVIHREGSHFFDDRTLLKDDDPTGTLMPNPPSGARQQRHYIPSPLSSPAAARRFGQRLGDKICSSPIVSRVKRRMRDESSGDLKRNGFCGLLSSFRDQEPENLFIFRTGDTGRIANRAFEDKWDVWTSMGEDMWEEWEEESESDEQSSNRDSTESSSSDNDFLELPLNDMTISAGRR